MEIYGLYFEENTESWIVCTSDGRVFIFNQQGSIERIANIAQQHPLF
jgi:hypothetical protein